MISGPQIAISRRGRVDLWCNNLRQRKDGSLGFYVINGDWRGSIKDGVVHVNMTGYEYPDNVISWQGEAPFGLADYDEAIAWIEKRS